MTGKKRNKSSAKNSPPSKRVKNINNYDNKEAKQHSGVYECLVCHKRLSSRQVLRDHEAIHTGVKRHKCPHCKKPFTHYVGMWGHKQKCSLRDSPPSKQENNNNEVSPIGAVAEPRQCCVCHGGDSSPGHLAEHSTEILTKIGIIDEDDDDETRPTCVVCYRVFESKLKYIKHLMEKHSIIYSFLTAKYLRSTSNFEGGFEEWRWCRGPRHLVVWRIQGRQEFWWHTPWRRRGEGKIMRPWCFHADRRKPRKCWRNARAWFIS